MRPHSEESTTVTRSTDESLMAFLSFYVLGTRQSGPSKEDEEVVAGLIGKRCIVAYTVPGVIVGINRSADAVYGGARFPLLVRQDSTGKVFEYGFEGFRLIDEA